MSTDLERRESSLPFETQLIGPKEQWLDPIMIRLFVNTTDKPIKLGFSHNIRAVEMIAIIEPTEDDLKGYKSKALIGETIEEE